MFSFAKDRKVKENKPTLSREEFSALKNKLKQRAKLLKTFPLFELLSRGINSSLATPKESRIPISLKDVQVLMLCTLPNVVNKEDIRDRWFNLQQSKEITQLAVLVIENVSVNDMEDNKNHFPHSLEIFSHGVEVMTNLEAEDLGLSNELAISPITAHIKAKISNAYPHLKNALDDGHVFSSLDIHNSHEYVNEENSLDMTPDIQNLKSKHVECTKTQLLLSTEQFFKEDIPVPGYNDSFCFSKDTYGHVTDESPLFAIDCEFVKCRDGSKGLARVAVVNEQLEPVYHSFVLPDKPIKDYLSKWSGITPEILRKARKSVRDVQNDLKELLPPDAILCGHDIKHDLRALEIFHPYVIDSAVIYNLTGSRPHKSRLKFLSAVFCDREIQSSLDEGHDPNEDALATMELVLLKLKMGLNYGDACLKLNGVWHGPSKEKILNVTPDVLCEHRVTEACDDAIDLFGLLSMKFLSICHIKGKSAALVANQKDAEIYRPKIPINVKLCDPNCKEIAPVKIIEEHDCTNALTAMQSEMTNNIVIGHIALDRRKEHSENLKDLDKAIADVYYKLALKGMLLVVFGGNTERGENGACMIRLKNLGREELAAM